MRRLKTESSTQDQNTSYIDPWFWTGLIDAEGSFTILIIKDIKRSLGWRVELKFQLAMHESDLVILNQLMKYLGVGKIYKGKNNIMNFVVTSIKDLLVLVAHLNKYPLQSQKHVDYLLFKAAIDIILIKEHLIYDGLLKIVNLKASLNNGLSETLKNRFPNYIPTLKPIVSPYSTLDLSWILGFINGDGSFDIHVVKNPKSSTGYRVQLRLRITQHNRDRALIQSIINTLNCGTLTYYTNNQEAVVYTVTSIKDIGNKVIPFIDNGCLLGGKQKDYIYWKTAYNLMSQGKHLSKDGMDEIITIKSKMMSSRYNKDLN